jgi:AraC family transcriptional regulator
MNHALVLSGMVCQRCVMVVQDILQKQNLPFAAIQVGKIILERDYTPQEFSELENALHAVGFEIVEGRIEQLITSIKNRVRLYLDLLASEELPNLSKFITAEIFYDYSYLSDLFSAAENKTIEQYFIDMRIDKVKEQLVYTQKPLASIAFDLGYSSPQHFANQFKQHTGQSPSAFRKMHGFKK